MRSSCIWLIAASIPAAPAWSQAAPPAIAPSHDAASDRPIEDLQSALEAAYRTHPNLLAERSKLEAADYRLPAANALFGPSLSFEARYGYTRDNAENSAGQFRTEAGWSSSATAILTQPLVTFGRNASQVKSATAQIEFQRSVLRSAEQQTMLNAVSAYVGLRRDRIGVTIASEYLATLERELIDNNTRFAAREVTSTDLQQVETRVALARAQLLTARRVAATSEAQFISLVGAQAGALAPPALVPLENQSLDTAYATAEQDNPIIAAAHAREKISRAQRDAARAEQRPRLDLRGTAGYGTVTPYTNSQRQTELRGEVVLSGPIFDSGLRAAQANEAEAANDADWRLIDAATRENRADVASAWNEWTTQRSSLTYLEQAVTAAKQAYDGALIQERAGMRTTLDVLDLARDALNARSSYNEADAGAAIAQARFMQAIGHLALADLAPQSALHDPEVHARRTKGQGGFPIITDVLRPIDAIGTSSRADRPSRDPAGHLDAPAASTSIGPEAPR